jgi:hypothetical protein
MQEVHQSKTFACTGGQECKVSDFQGLDMKVKTGITENVESHHAAI